MAFLVYNGTNFDTIVDIRTITSTSVNLTTSFQAGTAFTAPNTTNAITGVLFFVNSVPTSGSIEVEVRESGVTKVTASAAHADVKLGFNYIRFTTPYVFTTTSAGAYQARVRNNAASSGQLARESATSNIMLLTTYDSAVSIGATDNIFVCGHHNSGLTPMALNLTGTSNSWGAGTDRTLGTASTRTLGAATHIGTGGSVVFDTTANCKLTQLGSIFITQGGLLDTSPGASSVSTLEFNNDVADGDFGVYTASGQYGGQVITTGSTVAEVTTYASGVGTAANPLVTQANHGFAVNDELIIGGANTGTADYSKNELRYVKTIPAANQLVLSTTIGGAEAALTYTHAVGAHIGNLTRNSIVKATTSTRGFSVMNLSSNSEACDFSYTRFEYANCLSGKGMNLSSAGHAAGMDGMVCYENSANGRASVTVSGSIEQTISNVIMYNTRGTNFSAQSGFSLGSGGSVGKIIDGLYHFAAPGSTTNCAGLSINNVSTGNIIRNFHSYGGNSVNAGAGYALGVFGSGNTIEDYSINAARRQGMILDNCTLNEFSDGGHGDIATNEIDILTNTGGLVKAVFKDGTFGSATLISNYLNTLEGSEITFQNMDGDRSKHRWYTNRGSFWSSGPGLTDTTVRTAGSLALAIKPENGTSGAPMYFKVPANPESQVVAYGYLYRNATFSSGTLKVDLFLPRTSLTDTPDATYTLPTTTGAFLPWILTAYYDGEDSRYATVRITAVSATAGAYAFLDDLYDAGLNNKVAGLDLWDDGKISPIIIAADYSAIPEQTRLAVWSDTNTYGAGTKGKLLADVPTAADNADAVWDEPLIDHFAAGTAAGYLVITGAIVANTEIDGTPTATEIPLADGAAVDDFYKGMLFTLAGGSGAGQTANIAGYVASTKTLTLDTPLVITPANGDGVIIKGSRCLTKDEAAEAIWTRIIESGYTAEELMRLMSSISHGDGIDLQGANPRFKSIAGDKDRVVATRDGGNRTITGRDAT